MLTLSIRSVLLVLVSALPATAFVRYDDRASLLTGIEQLDQLGSPGRIAVFGESAFAVIAGGKAKAPDVMVAAAEYGQGRVLAVAHEAYLHDSGHESVTRLVQNALRWLSGGKRMARVGILGAKPGDVKRITAMGYEASELARAADVNGELDVLIWSRPREVGPEEVERLTTFVQEGGGVLVGVCPWGYEQVGRKRGADLRTTLSMNQVLAPMGLAFAPGMSRAKGDEGYRVGGLPLDEAHAGSALRTLEVNVRGSDTRPPEASFAALELALLSAPDSADGFRTRVEALIAGFDPERMPRPGKALKRNAPRERLYVAWYSRHWRDLPVDEVSAAPGAEHFPGAIPEGAERVTRELRFDGSVEGWHSTGLYAGPGEVFEVNCPEPRGWRVLVGCHRDRLWAKEKLFRWPDISAEFELESGVTRIATPFGGAIYLLPPGRSGGSVELELRGVVEAPHFVLGDVGSEEAWGVRRDAPAPWGELEGEFIVLTVPSRALRELEDPAGVVRFWDGVVASHRRLAGRVIARRERFVPDAQISAGYMHSGYPIMTQMDQVEPREEGGVARVLDLEMLRVEGSWGHFHELGHNLQRPDWTFRGTGEVTCNWFSLYSMESCCGIEPWEHPWLARQKGKAREYLADGGSFDEWKKDPGLALVFYAELQREVGWGVFERVLAGYEGLPGELRPKSEREKVLMFARRMSEAAGRDLLPVFEKWGLPVGE